MDGLCLTGYRLPVKVLAGVLCLKQLCPTRVGLHVAQSKFCAAQFRFSQFRAVVKVSYTLTTCPDFDNLEFDIIDTGGLQCHIITSEANHCS